MAKNKNLKYGLTLYIDGKEVKNNVTSIQAELRKTKKELDGMTIGSEEYVKATKKYKELKATLDQHKNRLKGVEEEQEKLTNGADKYGDAIKNALGLNSNFANSIMSLSSGGNGIKGMFSAMGQAVSAFGKTLMGLLANPVFLTIAGVAGAGMAFKWWFDYNKGIAEASRLTTEFLGVTGDEMKAVRSEIQSIADTWGKDYKEVLQTVDALMAQYHISAKEAMQVVTDGFVAGADLSGNMLQQIQQYAPTFHDAGVSASELVAILSQTRSGIFSEQGMQVIEMASKRIREMSTATAESLDAIHINSKQVTADLSSGAKSTFDVIQEISTALKQLPPDSQEVGAVLKDVFGRQGAGAGIQLIEQLDTMSTDLEKVKEQTGEYGKALEAQKDATTELNAATAALFDVTDKGFESALVGAKTFCIQGLTMIVRGVIDAINYFRDWYNESLVFRGAIEAIAFNFRQLWATVKLVFSVIMDGIKTSVKGLKGWADVLEGIVTLDFDKVKQGFDGIINSQIEGWGKMVDNFSDFGKESAENFADAWNNTVKGKRLEHINVPSSVSASNGQQVSLGGTSISPTKPDGGGSGKTGKTGKGGGGGGKSIDPVKAAMASIDVQVEQAKLQLKEQYLNDATMTQKQYNDRMKEIEYQGLAQKLSIAGMEESEKAKILSRLYDMEIALRNDTEKEILTQEQKAFQLRMETIEQSHLEQRTSEEEYQHAIIDAITDYYDQMLAHTELSEDTRASIIEEREKKIAEIRKQQMEKEIRAEEEANDRRKQIYKECFQDIEKTMQDFFEGELTSFGEFAQQMLITLVDTIEKAVMARQVEALAANLASNVGKYSFWGIAKAALEAVAIKAAFETVKAGLRGFSDGGFTGKGRWDEPQGIVHSGEFVANRYAVANPAVRPVLELINSAQHTGSIANLSGDDIAAVAGGRTSAVHGSGDGASMAALKQNTAVMEELMTAIDGGIECYVVLDGEKGLHKKYTHYKKLIEK